MQTKTAAEAAAVYRNVRGERIRTMASRSRKVIPHYYYHYQTRSSLVDNKLCRFAESASGSVPERCQQSASKQQHC